MKKDGESGHESYTRSAFALWPALRSSFEALVTPEEMPVRDDEGVATDEKYQRNCYMCAEPNALSKLLYHYDKIDHGLDENWISTLKFPARAIDDKKQGSDKTVPPCPVCSKWVTHTVPGEVHGLAVDRMRNRREIDRAQEKAHLEALRQEEEEEIARQKELAAKKKEKSRNADIAKRQVIAELRDQCDPKKLFGLIDGKIDLEEVNEEYKEYKKKKNKPLVDAKNSAALKAFTDSCLERWIMSLEATSTHTIMLYEDFDDGHQKEFQFWVMSEY